MESVAAGALWPPSADAGPAKPRAGHADDQHEDHQGRDRAQPARQPAPASVVPPGHRNPAESTESPAGSRRKPTCW